MRPFAHLPQMKNEPLLARPRIAPFNASTPIVMPPSPYAPDEQWVHPDVVQVPGGWNGYEYWMCCTTYASETQEDPCILVSNDRLTWVPPPGLTNPLSTGTNKDNDMLLVGDTMYLFWQQNISSQITTRLRTSTDGVTWTPAQTVISTPVGGNDIRLSPAIVYDVGTATWWMYTVDGTLSLDYRTASSPTGPWSAPSLIGYTVPSDGAGVHTPWHVDAFDFGGLHYLLINEDDQTGRNLRLAVSSDRVNFTPTAQPLMRTPPGGWDGNSLYRATCTIRPAGDLIYLWYSANDGALWRVGYTEVPVSGNLPTL